MTPHELQERYARLYRYIQADRLHTYPGSHARALADAAMADVEAMKRALKPLLAGHEATAMAGGQEDVFLGKHGGGS